MKALLDALRDVCDVRGRRERREAELRRQLILADTARMEQMQDLLEAIVGRVVETNKHQSEALIEVAKGVQENARALNRWMGLFEQSQAEGFTHTVRPADELAEHEQRERERLKAEGYPVDAEETVQRELMAQMLGDLFAGQRG